MMMMMMMVIRLNLLYYTIAFTNWETLPKPRTIDLNTIELCSVDGRHLMEAKAVKYHEYYPYGKRVLRITTREYDENGTVSFFTGTGFLVGDRGHFMTAHHVLSMDSLYSTQQVAIEIMAEGNTSKTICNDVPFDCTGYVNKNDIHYVMSGQTMGDDWAMYQFTGTDRTEFLTRAGGSGLKLSLHIAKPYTHIYSFHHIRGVGKKANVQAGEQVAHIRQSISFSSATTSSTTDMYLSWMDISFGGSGAPLIEVQSNTVYGIHVAETPNSPCRASQLTGPLAIRSGDIAFAMEEKQVNRSSALSDDDIDLLRKELFISFQEATPKSPRKRTINHTAFTSRKKHELTVERQ